MNLQNKQTTGILAALGSAFFLGVSPVFGKLAINLGLSPLAVVALRTSLATALLFVIVVIFNRSALYIFPVGFIGCMMAGVVNGFGSLLYYMALYRLPASVGQLLYSLYPFFVAIWLALDHQPPSRLTLARIALAALAVLLLTNVAKSSIDTTGVFMMIGAALLYALHLPINQRVLYEVPAPTVTLYTLFAMSAVVVPAYLLFDRSWPTTAAPWAPVIGLTLATFLSRLSLFFGIKRIGGMQTALLGLAELLVTILFSYFWLHENLTPLQWLGAFGLGLSLLLVRFEKSPKEKHSPHDGWLSWIRSPGFTKDIWPPYQ
ncbi:MAG TPA: DMT family transporter [Anaerolineales bacterium]|nr:DMT family transporter [Anaerolineales bacterium]